MAYLALLAVNQVLPETGKPFGELAPTLQHWVQTDLILANGFIVTSLLWATMLAHVIDGRIRAAAATVALAAVLALFGVIHSPLPSAPILTPAEAVRRLEEDGRGKAAALQTPYHMAGAYGVVALVLLGFGTFGTPPAPGTRNQPHAV
ncbi:MAG: hypothetical protein U0794_13100 [Isosphaeraceae bacterium]